MIRPLPERMERVQTPVIPVVGGWIRSCPGTISLGQGVVHYGPPAEALDGIGSFLRDPENHKYKLVDGIPVLRDGLRTKLEAENGIRLADESALVVTGGSNMAFMNAVLAITDPGDEVILQSPYYFNHEMAVTMAGCVPRVVSTDGNWLPQPERVAAAITNRTRAIVTISPNNPTGAVYPEPLLREINALCARHGVYHIHDEAYEYFIYGATPHFSPGSIAGAAPHTISLFSFSKSYGFASWRIGYMVLPAGLLEAVKKIQDTIQICPPVISQFAAAGALRAGSAYCRKHVAAMGQVRANVLAALGELSGFCDVAPSEGAFYVLVGVRGGGDPLALTERLIREDGVAVIPGSAFGLEEGCYLRMAYGALQPETVAEGVGRFVRGLKKVR